MTPLTYEAALDEIDRLKAKLDEANQGWSDEWAARRREIREFKAQLKRLQSLGDPEELDDDLGYERLGDLDSLL